MIFPRVDQGFQLYTVKGDNGFYGFLSVRDICDYTGINPFNDVSTYTGIDGITFYDSVGNPKFDEALINFKRKG